MSLNSVIFQNLLLMIFPFIFVLIHYLTSINPIFSLNIKVLQNQEAFYLSFICPIFTFICLGILLDFKTVISLQWPYLRIPKNNLIYFHCYFIIMNSRPFDYNKCLLLDDQLYVHSTYDSITSENWYQITMLFF